MPWRAAFCSQQQRPPGCSWSVKRTSSLGWRSRPLQTTLLASVALVRNATEANNVVCNGLDLQPKDEVLLTDQEHPGGRCCWEQKAARHGIRLNYVALPRPPVSV